MGADAGDDAVMLDANGFERPGMGFDLGDGTGHVGAGEAETGLVSQQEVPVASPASVQGRAADLVDIGDCFGGVGEDVGGTTRRLGDQAAVGVAQAAPGNAFHRRPHPTK